MLNKVYIVGRLGKPVELKYTQSGNAIAQFTIATDESYNDRNGNKVEQTEWHRIVAYGKQAETCSRFLDKGSLVLVEGKLKTRKWQDRDGKDRYVTEIAADRVLFLDKKQERQDQHSAASQRYDPQPAQQDFEQDALPF